MELFLAQNFVIALTISLIFAGISYAAKAVDGGGAVFGFVLATMILYT